MAFRQIMIPQQIRQNFSNLTTEVHICITYKKIREIPVVIVNLDFQDPLQIFLERLKKMKQL